MLSDFAEEWGCNTSWLGSRTKLKTKTSHSVNITLRVTTGFKHRDHSVRHEGALPAKTCGMKKVEREEGLRL